VNQFLKRLIQSLRALIPQPIPVKSKNTPIFSKNLYKGNTNVLIIQYIYINMRRFYKNLNENEIEPNELNDFRKILALNKKKIDPNDVYFEDSEGKDYNNIIEVTQTGLIFTFDDLEDYLKFFFPSTYEEGSEGEWDAVSYDRMYNGNYDFYNEFSDRATDDWNEGYVTNGFSHENMEKLKELLSMVSPNLLSKISYYKTKKISDDDATLIRDFLSSLQLEDDLTGVYVDGQVEATEEDCKRAIKDTYCDCFYDIGIERYSNRYCFWKYELDWGSAILLFARFGTEEDKLLDLLFNATDTNSRNHLPTYYEMHYNYWDQEKFNSVFHNQVDNLLDKTIENVMDNEDYNKKYFKTIGLISQIGGIGNWIESRDKKFKIRISDVDSKTAKITYQISSNSWGGKIKLAKSNLKVLLDYLNQGQLFDPLDYRD
jgi:hypothetical protein